MKKIIKDYFTFSRRERTAIIILILVIGSFIVLPYFFSNKKDKVIANTQLQQQLAQVQVKDSSKNSNKEEDSWQTAYQPSKNIAPVKYELFEFNPNTIDAEGWKKLGLPDKTIKTILNYRSKGGKFRSAEDIRKIWGLKKEDADRIIPYAKVDEVVKQYNSSYSQNKQTATKIIQPVDINSATPEQLKTLPGMDYSTPYKIIKYRDKLGGFLAIEQVKETFGLADSTYQSILPYLKIQSTNIRKININTVSDFDLSTHPYVSRDVAKAIVIYRNQHGAYKQIDDIKKIVFINEEMFKKISPYLTVE
jgi:DNA uptake protein ComE-like DNA-binding protein